MSKESLLNRLEAKRKALNLKVLPETISTLNRYVGYLSDLAARRNLNESPLTVSLLVDEFARDLNQDKDFLRWSDRPPREKRASEPADTSGAHLTAESMSEADAQD